jgi:hypothetical protein
MAKAKKAKKEKQAVTVIVTPADAFCARSAQEKIRHAFQAKPSPQEMVFPTPLGKITVTREKEKGFAAKWFSTDEKGRKFEGDKKSVRENVGEMVALSFRLAKMQKSLVPQKLP